MNYLEFKQILEPFCVFSVREIYKQFDDFDRRRLVEWQKKGYIIKIRNGYYCFSDWENVKDFRFFVGTKINNPSYISLESALSWYGFIPEGVFQITLCTTLKTNEFNTPVGNFSYKHLKPEMFYGYHLKDFKEYHYPFAFQRKLFWIIYIYILKLRILWI